MFSSYDAPHIKSVVSNTLETHCISQENLPRWWIVTCCWWRQGVLEMAFTFTWPDTMRIFHVRSCGKNGFCPIPPQTCKGIQRENHYGSEECYVLKICCSKWQEHILPTWYVMRHKEKTQRTLVITSEHCKININFSLIKLMFTINLIRFNFALPNIHWYEHPNGFKDQWKSCISDCDVENKGRVS